MNKTEELNKQYGYKFDYWKSTTGFEPVELLAHYDNAGSYEMSEMHVFKLKRGYALVHESGCSCYSSDEASIEIFPTKAALKESLKNSAKQQYSSGELARNILQQLLGGK